MVAQTGKTLYYREVWFVALCPSMSVCSAMCKKHSNISLRDFLIDLLGSAFKFRLVSNPGRNGS